MSALHIVQGGVANSDRDWLITASRDKRDAKNWTVPKSAEIGDEVVVFVQGIGFFATARINSIPKPRWKNRYGAGLTQIKLIKNPVPLDKIKRHVGGFKWANYPRSITTPLPVLADKIRKLIARHCKPMPFKADESRLDSMSIEQLRFLALMKARPSAPKKERIVVYRIRSKAIGLFVLKRAAGRCEGCRKRAPFRKRDGSYYLEPHHTLRVSDEGPDHPAHVIGLCPNCHCRVHHAEDAEAFNQTLINKLRKIEKWA